MIALLGMGRVKFGYGVQERLVRLLTGKYDSSTSSNSTTPPKEVDVVSCLLNPSARDSESPTAQLQLALGYGPYLKDQRPFGNYLWYSSTNFKMN